MHGDHYQALGVPPNAGRAEIRAAYLRLMRDHHPDRRPHDAAAAERARQLNVAYAVLRDNGKRAHYDRLRVGRYANAPDAVRRVITPPAQAAAYSAEGHAYRRAFHRACLRIGGGVFTLGLLLLFALSA